MILRSVGRPDLGLGYRAISWEIDNTPPYTGGPTGGTSEPAVKPPVRPAVEPAVPGTAGKTAVLPAVLPAVPSTAGRPAVEVGGWTAGPPNRRSNRRYEKPVQPACRCTGGATAG